MASMMWASRSRYLRDLLSPNDLSDLKYTRQYNPSLEILELTMPRSGVCPQKFGFSYRLLSGVDGSVGFVYRVKPDSVASRAGLFYGDMIAKVNDRMVVPKDNPRIREIIHSSSYVSLAVYAHNPFRLAQLHRDIAHVLKMDRNDAKDLRLMCFRDKCRLRAGFSLKTFISAADGGTYSAHIFHRVHPKLMKGEMDNRLYAGDLLLCVNGIPTTGMKSQKEVADIVKLHRRGELILSILPCSPLRVPN